MSAFDLAVFGERVQRAAALAPVMTADHVRHGHDEDPWTTEDVLRLALVKGLELLEKQYGVSRLPG